MEEVQFDADTEEDEEDADADAEGGQLKALENMVRSNLVRFFTNGAVRQ